MHRVDEFMYHDIVDDLRRCHKEFPREVESIATTTRSPSGCSTRDTDLFIRESVFFGKVSDSLGEVLACLFPVPLGKECFFRGGFLCFPRKNEHSFGSENRFLLEEIAFERIRLSEIIKISTLLFFPFCIMCHMFSDPIRFPFHKSVDNIRWYRKRGSNNESFLWENLDGNRSTRSSDNLKRRDFGHTHIVRFFGEKSRKCIFVHFFLESIEYIG